MKKMKTTAKPKIDSNTLMIIVAILVAGFIVGGAIYFSSSPSKTGGEVKEEIVNNVSVVDGKQIIEIRAKGGYYPVHSIAKAGIPTILRLNTNGTFDCTSSVRIPSLNISQSLPLSGSTDISLGIQKATVIQGTCGMGMYPFDITFQ